MLKPKTYRERNRLLLIGIGLFSVVAYWLSISDTVALYGENRLVEARLDSASAAPASIARLTKELEAYDHALRRLTAGGAAGEERLLQEVARVCQQRRVTLISLPPAGAEERNGYTVLTHAVKLEGGYGQLVQATHDLESLLALGRIASVRFALEEDRRTRKASLFAYIYLQHVKKGGDSES